MLVDCSPTSYRNPIHPIRPSPLVSWTPLGRATVGSDQMINRVRIIIPVTIKIAIIMRSGMLSLSDLSV